MEASSIIIGIVIVIGLFFLLRWLIPSKGKVGEKVVAGKSVIDANKCFDKAKVEMLERKKNIELRLVSVDEPPQKRRELRAEM